jgi:DNA-binding MarR family transcriptional regulator
MADDAQDLPLPLNIEDRAHRAAVSVWWTGTLLKKASGRLFQSMNSSEAQFNLMIVLRDAPGPHTQNDISKMLLVDKSNITGLVDRLEAQGWIKRNRVEGDRRSYHITLTRRGRDALEKMDSAYRKTVQEIVSDLRPEEYEQLAELVARLRRGLARTGLLD